MINTRNVKIKKCPFSYIRWVYSNRRISKFKRAKPHRRVSGKVVLIRVHSHIYTTTDTHTPEMMWRSDGL